MHAALECDYGVKCGGQRATLRSWVSPAILQDPETELTVAGLCIMPPSQEPSFTLLFYFLNDIILFTSIGGGLRGRPAGLGSLLLPQGPRDQTQASLAAEPSCWPSIFLFETGPFTEPGAH